MIRTLTTTKGKSVVTPLHDLEAIDLLAEVGTEFARDLLRKHNRFGLSADQVTWAHILAIEFLQQYQPRDPRLAAIPGAERVGDANHIAGIYALFQRTNGKLKYPAVKLILGEEMFQVALSPKGPLNVSNGLGWNNGNVFYGKILPNGEWKPSGATPEGMLDAIRRFAED